jgi:hypothetical protein
MLMPRSDGVKESRVGKESGEGKEGGEVKKERSGE